MASFWLPYVFVMVQEHVTFGILIGFKGFSTVLPEVQWLLSSVLLCCLAYVLSCKVGPS